MTLEEFAGSSYFRQRLVLAVLSGKSIRISRIRQKDEHPGLCGYELNFLALLAKITNGTSWIIDETGTKLTFLPGLLSGGICEHDCQTDRSITYYLEALLLLAPFTKQSLEVVFSGITNDELDPSIDAIKHSSLPLLQKFLGTDEGLDLKISARGLRPNGGGKVRFTCPSKLKLRPLRNMEENGLIRSIRGIAFTCGISPSMGNRLGEAAKKILKEFVADIYCYTDQCKGERNAGRSKGYGITLVAETEKGFRYAVDVISEQPRSPAESSEQSRTMETAEEMGERAALLLLEEIYRGGCVDSINQSLALLLMCLGQNGDVSKIQTGPLSPFTIQLLRYIKDFFSVEFRITADSKSLSDPSENSKTVLSCVGIGYSNISKTVS